MSGCVILRESADHATIGDVEPPISHSDVATIMALLGDIKTDIHELRNLLEDDGGEEEAPEIDA